MKRSVGALAASCLLTLVVATGVMLYSTPAQAQWGGSGWKCMTFRDSTVTNVISYGDCCAGTGAGCTECFDLSGWSCVTNGTYCSPMKPDNGGFSY